MKQLALIITAIVLALGMASCHSNEKNYKMAYDKALERQRDGVGEETMNKINAEQKRYTHVINGDSVRMLHIPVNVALDSAKVAHRYNVVVAEFKQQFNAKTLRDRLRSEEGYPSYLLFGGKDRKYFVVIKGFDESDVAAAFIKTLDQKLKMPMLTPIPWIIER